MKKLPLILEHINQSFDLTITPLTNHSRLDHKFAINLSSELYSNLIAKTTNKFGSEILQFGISPESYMRYKNGRVSSIIKGESGFKSHEGFEAVQMVNIVDSIFTEVNQFLTNRVMGEFQALTNNIFSSINLMQGNLLNQAFYFKEQEHVEDLASFQDFFQEINDELGDISASSERSSAYIGNFIDIRKNIYKTYNYFIKKLQNWPSNIGSMDGCGNFLSIDYTALQNDYFFCRQAINCYMITLVYEYIISGSIDDKSREKIVRKIESFLIKFRSADDQIKFALNRRDSANKSWNWYYRPDKQNDSSSIGWFFSQFQTDPNFEITKVNEVFRRSKELLNCIPLIIDNSSDK